MSRGSPGSKSDLPLPKAETISVSAITYLREEKYPGHWWGFFVWLFGWLVGFWGGWWWCGVVKQLFWGDVREITPQTPRSVKKREGAPEQKIPCILWWKSHFFVLSLQTITMQECQSQIQIKCYIIEKKKKKTTNQNWKRATIKFWNRVSTVRNHLSLGQPCTPGNKVKFISFSLSMQNISHNRKLLSICS